MRTIPRIILITGARKGIGEQMVRYYCRQGHYVIGCSRKNADFNFRNYQHFSLDVADEVAVTQMFSSIRKTFKRLDVLINNAGIASMNHALLTPMETVHRIFSTNVFGNFLLVREAAKLMQIKKWGRIINFSSVAVPLKLEGESIYSASKAAVENMTKIIGSELAPYGITVNAIGPTPIQTDLIRSVPPKKIKALLDRQAIHRLGKFEDIFNVIDFFVSPRSDFITGQVLYLGGV